MTRINSAINVRNLTDTHLLSEARELPRICSVYKKRVDNKIGFKDAPSKFTLGTGHVLFFADKGRFTLNRYEQIYQECIDRGFKVTNYSDNWSVYGSNLKDYSTTDEEHRLLVERISERIVNSKKDTWHYYGQILSKEECVKLLNK